MTTVTTAQPQRGQNNPQTKTLIIPIVGMHCANCANTVSRSLKRLQAWMPQTSPTPTSAQ